ncbi:MAG TPA: amidohydrolase family protein [Mycobacteriales bacterium]|nr:amidohydrolase family protein [Mycobacteriales bacterium]
MRWRPRRPAELVEIETAVVFDGDVWVGDGTQIDAGRVVVDSAGVVTAIGRADDVDMPRDAIRIAAGWIGPGLYDAHVHLAFGRPEDIVAGGVVEVRDLGAPPADAARWRRLAAPRVSVAGPLLTAPGGYPSTSWGSRGFAAFVDDVEQTARLVGGLAGEVDVVKLALEPAGGPVPSLELARAVVEAAHVAGRTVVCHALTVDMVERALDAGVDELVHTPTEPLPAELVARIATSGVGVVSTLHTFEKSGSGANAVANAAALVEAGVAVRYGTDLGNAGVVAGADVRELELLATEVGMGSDGALRAATRPLKVGKSAGVVALDRDPRSDVRAWRRPASVQVGRMHLQRQGSR